jgi:hypothetical protein
MEGFMRLSEHFMLDEFCRSETAARMGHKVIPSQDVIDNLRELCVTLLEPARSILGDRAITPTSGYRPKWLNNLIGGSVDSDHVLGGAVDFQVSGLEPSEVCRVLSQSELPFRQLIKEFDSWTHISKARAGEEPKRQVLTAIRTGARTIYKQGIIE